MFPPLIPLQTGHLCVKDGNEIYWEASGNPDGKPALYLHGGPGGGMGASYRRHFDPDAFLIIGFDQRGCGRSRPLVTGPGADLAANTTQAIIADMEALREQLGVSAWLILGISWGTALGLAYAQAHPDRVTALVLALIHIPSRLQVEWATEQMRQVFPQEWSAFALAAHRQPGQRLIDAYYERITHPDRDVREAAALAWCRWEDAHVALAPGAAPCAKFLEPEFRMVFATLVIHYWKHAAFLNEAGILENMRRIAHLPGVLIHGRLDVSSPLSTAWELHRCWPGSQLSIIADEGHGGPRMVEEINAAVREFRGQGHEAESAIPA